MSNQKSVTVMNRVILYTGILLCMSISIGYTQDTSSTFTREVDVQLLPFLFSDPEESSTRSIYFQGNLYLGSTLLSDTPSGAEFYNFNPHFALGASVHIRLARHMFLGSEISYVSDQYRFRNNLTINPNEGDSFFVPTSVNDHALNASRMRLHSIGLSSLTFTYRTLSVAHHMDFTLSARSKIVHRSDGRRSVDKVNITQDIRSVRHSLIFRAMILDDNTSLFYKRTLSPLFNTQVLDQQPLQHSIGVMIQNPFWIQYRPAKYK